KKKGDLKAVEAKATGTIKGKVTYKGKEKPNEPIPFGMEPFVKDADHCKKGQGQELLKQDLIVSTNGDLANVVVWLRAPDGHFFNVPEDQRKRTDTVAIDQPHCAFIPHALVLFPSYYDAGAKKQERTGQKFVVKNSAPIPHNTNWTQTKINSGDNKLLSPN